MCALSRSRPSKTPPDCDWRMSVCACMCRCMPVGMCRLSKYVLVCACMCMYVHLCPWRNVVHRYHHFESSVSPDGSVQSVTCAPEVGCSSPRTVKAVSLWFECPFKSLFLSTETKHEIPLLFMQGRLQTTSIKYKHIYARTSTKHMHIYWSNKHILIDTCRYKHCQANTWT